MRALIIVGHINVATKYVSFQTDNQLSFIITLTQFPFVDTITQLPVSNVGYVTTWLNVGAMIHLISAK